MHNSTTTKIAPSNAFTLKQCVLIIFLTTAGSAILAVGWLTFLEKRFQSESQVRIQTTYLSHSPENNFLIPVDDAAALKSQRLALFTQALSDQFLDSFADNFGLLTNALDPTARNQDRELIRQKIHFSAVDSNTFSIGIVGRTPQLSRTMNEALSTHLEQVVIAERNASLARVKAALELQLSELRKNIRANETAVEVAAIERTLHDADVSLREIFLSFDEHDPVVNRIRRQSGIARASSGGLQAADLTPATSKASIHEASDTLIRKLISCTELVSLEHNPNDDYFQLTKPASLPTKAETPDYPSAALAGSVTGLFISIVLLTSRELNRNRPLSASESSELLDAPWWGVLPELKG